MAYRELDVPTPKLELVAAWQEEQVSPVLQTFLKVVREVIANKAR
ncbi:MAG: hypothetical protein ACFCAD_02910 [Pleurocapsa sp.]